MSLEFRLVDNSQSTGAFLNAKRKNSLCTLQWFILGRVSENINGTLRTVSCCCCSLAFAPKNAFTATFSSLDLVCLMLAYVFVPPSGQQFVTSEYRDSPQEIGNVPHIFQTKCKVEKDDDNLFLVEL